MFYLFIFLTVLVYQCLPASLLEIRCVCGEVTVWGLPPHGTSPCCPQLITSPSLSPSLGVAILNYVHKFFAISLIRAGAPVPSPGHWASVGGYFF